MLARINAWLISRRFKRLVRPFDQRIAEARRDHKPVRHIQAERASFVHACLRAGRP